VIFAAIAWRNLWKRKRLTAILTLGIAAGVFSLLLYFAMLDGFLAMMVDTAVDTTLGHIQLHEKSYLAKKDVNALLPDSAALVRSLASLPNIAGVSPRVCAQGLASSARGSGSVAFCGMDPEKERRVTGLQGLLVKGEPLAPGDDEGIMIGRELAKKLRIDTGSKLVIMVRDAAGEMTGRAYRVRGLFTTVSSDFDKTAVFVSRRSACTLLGLPGTAPTRWR